MKVAVAGVEYVGDPHAVTGGQRLDLSEYRRERRPRYDPVLNDVVRADPADRRERRLASTPEGRAFRGVDCGAYLERIVRAADRIDRGVLGLHFGGWSVHLDDQHGAGS